MDRLPPASPVGAAIRGFHAAIRAYFADVTSFADALDAVAHGLAFLAAAKLQAAPDGNAR